MIIELFPTVVKYLIPLDVAVYLKKSTSPLVSIRPDTLLEKDVAVAIVFPWSSAAEAPIPTIEDTAITLHIAIAISFFVNFIIYSSLSECEEKTVPTLLYAQYNRFFSVCRCPCVGGASAEKAVTRAFVIFLLAAPVLLPQIVIL